LFFCIKTHIVAWVSGVGRDGGLFEAHDRSGAGHDWTAAHAAHWPRHVMPRCRQQCCKCIIL